MINFLIAEDMENDLHRLEKLVKKQDFEINIYKATDGLQAYEILSEKTIDGALIDIKMPGMDGFELAQRIRRRRNSNFIHIIFITTTDNNSIDTYMTYHNYSYIQKPYTNEEVSTVLYELLTLIQSDKRIKLIEERTVELRADSKQIVVPLDEILYIEATQKYRKIVTYGEEYKISSGRSKEIIEAINSPEIIRCHRSFYANINNVSSINKVTNKSYELYFTKDGSIRCPLSYKYKAGITRRFDRGFDD